MKFLISLLSVCFSFLAAAEMMTETYHCDDCLIFYRSIGKGDPVFIVHGGPGLDHSYFLPAMDVLAASHQVIYYDQRGTGRSTCSVNCDTISMDNFVQDLENLRKHLQLEKITLLGHSWGALVSIEYALKFPERVQALILLNPLPATPDGLERYYENLGVRLKSVSDKLVQIETSENFKNREPETVRNYLQLIFPKYFFDEHKMMLLETDISDTTSANLFKVGEFLDNDYLNEYDLRERMKAITIPTLIIYGDSDPVPKKYAEQFHSYIKNSEFLVLPNCGHFSFVEQPIALFKTIEAFFNPSQQGGA